MQSEVKNEGSWLALFTSIFGFAFTIARIYFFKEQNAPHAITHEDIKEAKKMETVAVTLNVPKAEKDAIDMVMVIVNDLKANKSSQLVSDALPGVIKLIGELSELMTELKSKQSVASLAYLAQQIAGV